MAEPIATHRLALACDKATVRHLHEYRPGPDCPQRCQCGHTRWQIRVGGHNGPSVSCAKCGSTNRISTAYEKGRAAAFTELTRQEAAPL